MSFIDDLRESRELFAKIASGQRLAAKEQKAWDEIKAKYGLTPEETVGTQQALAECLGVARQTIVRWKQEGMPVEPDGSYDPIRVAHWRDLVHPEQERIPGTSPGEDGPNWETEFRKFRAKMAELDYKKALGELILRTDVETLLTDRAIEFKRALLERGRRLSGDLAHKDARDIQRILDEDARDLLQTYTRPHQLGVPAVTTEEEVKEA